MNRLLKTLAALLLTLAYVGCGGGGGGGGSATLDEVDPGVLAGNSVVDAGVNAADTGGDSGDSTSGDSGSSGGEAPSDGGATPPGGDGTPATGPTGGTNGGNGPAPVLTNNEVLFDVIHYSYQSETVEEYTDIEDALEALSGWEGDGAWMFLELLRGELRDEILADVQNAIILEGHSNDPMTADTLQHIAQIVLANRRVERDAGRIAKMRELMVGTALELTLSQRLDDAEAQLATLEAAITDAVNAGLHESFSGPVDSSAMFHGSSSAPSAGNLSDMAAFEAAIIDAVGGLMEQVLADDETAIELGAAFYAAYEALAPLGVSSTLNRDNIAAKAAELADVDRLIVADAPMPGLGEDYSVMFAPVEGPAESEETIWEIAGDDEMIRSLSPFGMLLSSDGDLTDRRFLRVEFRNVDGRRHVAELEIISLPIEIVRRKVMASVNDVQGDAIAGARVELLEGPTDESRIARGEHGRLLRTESDGLGLANLPYVAEGIYFARVSAPGYETVVVPVDVFADAGDYAIDPVVLHDLPE